MALAHIVTRLRCPQLACCSLEYEAQKQGAVTARVEPEDPQPLQGGLLTEEPGHGRLLLDTVCRRSCWEGPGPI